MVYQFLGEEENTQAQTQMAPVGNPYAGKAPPLPAQRGETPAEIEAQARALASQYAPPQTPVEPPAEPPPQPPESDTTAAPPNGAPPESRPSSLEFIRPLTPEPERGPAPQAHKTFRIRHEQRVAREQDLQIPPGFVKNLSRHFVIYSEDSAASEQFMSLAENLHGNLMLDLSAFSPWASEEKVTIFLFRNQRTYRQVTGRPEWSGGASSVPKRRLYIYESDELPSILAHEMCHIYYDGFYLDGTPDPLWLSEGMATLIQVERGLAAPQWLRDNLQTIERGGGYSLDELMSITTLAGASDDKVRLWYTESYSVVRFLIRAQYKSSFYKFSEYLREGKDVPQALYRGYGMPYNRIKALEYAWRYDLSNSSLSRLSRADR
jgi:hypothetical protein